MLRKKKIQQDDDEMERMMKLAEQMILQANMSIGLPSLKDKQFELGFTDSPWGVDQHKMVDNKRVYYGSVLEVKDNKKYYDDKFDSIKIQMEGNRWNT
jgi:hypothetical protein